ncbi:hypothetical protein [Methanohalophilus sp.]|uniref:hypothetical protein n=1 Tax=Methanohalophilus sp. TaxID=1966352 RepID=UPI00261E3A6C|nr:hypothetical protein [Methanohalophilus sp.]MDK2892641.1 hypothetical protein [Methanohalophilus sp.]
MHLSAVILNATVQVSISNQSCQAVANHFSRDISDFSRRLKSLLEKELEYPLDLIKDGRESLGCLRPNYLMAFREIVASRVGEEQAGEIVRIYTANNVCE